MRADRLLSLMLMLQARGKMTSQALADELEVSKRTILRDVDALSSAGVPVYAEGGHGGGIALDENYRVALSGLQEGEVRSLFITGSAALLSDLGLGTTAENALLKLFAALPSLHQRAAHDMRQRLLLDPTWWWHGTLNSQPYLNDLQQAVYEDRCVRVVYERRRGETFEDVIAAYSLVAKAGIWYLVGLHEGTFKTYRVSRFHAVTVLPERFQRQDSFDLAAYWRESVAEFVEQFPTYRMVLRVARDHLAYLQWDTPGTYEIIEDNGGEWVTVEFTCWSREAARGFVFGLGSAAAVIEPDNLRDDVLARARAIIAQYG